MRTTRGMKKAKPVPCSMTAFSWEGVLTILGSGALMNLTQGVCSFLTMVLFSKPLLEKLDRIRVKYGMMEEDYGL